jgi:hypothetical protein
VGHEVADPKESRGHFLLWLTYGFSLEYSQGRRGLELTEPQPQCRITLFQAAQRLSVAQSRLISRAGFKSGPKVALWKCSSKNVTKCNYSICST